MTSIPNPVASTAAARPRHTVLRTEDGSLTAKELCQQVAERASALAEQGVKPGMAVALVGRASVDWAVSFHALGWLGAAALPLSPRASPQELARALDIAKATHIIAASGLQLPPLAVPALGVGETGRTPTPERFWPLDESRLVLFTSGSTGEPRPVALSTEQLLFSAMGSAIRLGHLAEDRWLCCLPLWHIGGLSILIRCAWYGTCVELHDKFDAARVAAALDGGAVTQVSLVPTMLQRVLAARTPQRFPPQLRVILLGGAAAAPDLLARCRAMGAPVALSWGMTETASQVATHAPGCIADGIGPPLPFARVEAADGHLEVRGPITGKDCAVRTNDCGRVDSLGIVHVNGRSDRVIVSGGEKIDSKEVEQALRAHPAVHDAVVVGVPDAEWGQWPVALLTAREGAEPRSHDSMTRWCRDRLAWFQPPRSFFWLDELPSTELGKLPLYNVRALAKRLESDARKADAQHLRHATGPLAGSVNAGMDQLRGGTKDAVISKDPVVEGHGLVTDGHQVEGDSQPISHLHRSAVVGFSVDHRQSPRHASESLLGPTKGSSQHFLEGNVAVVEHASKEDHTGAIDLKKAGSDRVLKRHSISFRSGGKTGHEP